MGQPQRHDCLRSGREQLLLCFLKVQESLGDSTRRDPQKVISRFTDEGTEVQTGKSWGLVLDTSLVPSLPHLLPRPGIANFARHGATEKASQCWHLHSTSEEINRERRGHSDPRVCTWDQNQR